MAPPFPKTITCAFQVTQILMNTYSGCTTTISVHTANGKLGLRINKDNTKTVVISKNRRNVATDIDHQQLDLQHVAEFTVVTVTAAFVMRLLQLVRCYIP